VEKVRVEEMKAVVTELKVKDTTFVKAVVVEQENSNGEKGAKTPGINGGGPSAMSGADTLAAIQDMVKNRPEISVPKAGDLGIPGSFQAQTGFNGNFNPGFNKPLARLKVIFHR
jgi:hypothetical protein